MPKKYGSPNVFTNLLPALVYRDITQRYRRSLLGPFWAILQPFILMVFFSMLRNFVNIPSDGVPYAIFCYSALVPWTFFTNAVMSCGPSFLQNAAIIKKTPIPREVFPLSAVITALFDFMMAFIVLVGMMFWFKVKFTWLMLWVFPLVFITALLALAVGMGIAALGVFKRDFIHAAPFFLQLWMFISPIIYPFSSVPQKWTNLYILNPMVGIIEGFRNVLVKSIAPPLLSLSWSLAAAVIALSISWLVFRRLSQYFADAL